MFRQADACFKSWLPALACEEVALWPLFVRGGATEKVVKLTL